MTATVTRLRTDATQEQRRAALIELAEQISVEDRFPNSAPFTPVLGLIVPSLASHLVARDLDLTLNLFSELIGAVKEFGRFVGNEDDWLAEHELPRTDRTRATTYERLRSDVDLWADRLMARAS